MAGHDIIVVGGSAGGVEGSSRLPAGCRPTSPAAVFVVIHTSPSQPQLPPRPPGSSRAAAGGHSPGWRSHPAGSNLRRPSGPPPRARIRPGSGHPRPEREPLPPGDRPAVPLRGAGLWAAVVGVVLSGSLDDGTAGLSAVKARGGLAIVQDPEEALIRSMPESAMRQTRVDYCLRLLEIAPTLARLAAEPADDAEGFPVPEGLETETRIAMHDKALQVGLGEIGEPSMFACPECHGVLLRLKAGGGLRFRCHTGHAYTAAALLAELTESVEDALWNSIRSVEESSLLMDHIATHMQELGGLRVGRALQTEGGRGSRARRGDEADRDRTRGRERGYARRGAGEGA